MADFEAIRRPDPITLRFRDESSAKINESLASCLDLGIFGAKRAVLGIASLGGCNMASAFGPRLWRRTTVSVPPARSLGRRMTWHAATALLAFAALQIWLVMSAVAAGAPSAFIVVALVMLLVLALPVARSTERHWYRLSRQALASWGLHARFRRDVRRLWVAALTLPFLWISGAMAATDAIAKIAN
ncbi:MAG: hypothetical protein ACT6RX_11000 [Sphingopyxis solisilvae]|uniref:hypothetical protein n=1 Tax=Sphingopyxis solisilvae TaxID=1886788 RepID=UPI0040375EE4